MREGNAHVLRMSVVRCFAFECIIEGLAFTISICLAMVEQIDAHYVAPLASIKL